MSLGDCEWRLLREASRPGADQMALDEIAAETAGSGGPATARVYRWEPSTLSLGYHQSLDSVDRAYCEQEDIDVTRRQTGGGGIYHDAFGDVSYSIVVPAGAVPGNLMESYHLLLRPILAALERMGVDAGLAERERPAVHQPACYLRRVDPAHDVVVDGKKISGNAQYRQRDGVVQHGSITFSRTTERHLRVFGDPVSAGDFEDRVTSVRAVTGIGRAEAVETIEGALSEWCGAGEGSWSDDELADARELAAEKYDDEDWIAEY